MKKILFYFLLNFILTTSWAQKRVVSGYIRDKVTQEAIINAYIELNNGTYAISNTYGFYNLILKNDTATVKVHCIGYKLQTIKLNIKKDTTINFFLDLENHKLD